jgi:hypothetical protein
MPPPPKDRIWFYKSKTAVEEDIDLRKPLSVKELWEV